MNRLVLFCLLGLLAACGFGSGSRESGIVTHVLADGRPRPLPLDSLFSAYRFVHPATSDSTLLSTDCFIRLGSDEVWVYSNKTFYRFGMDGVLRGSFSRPGPGPQEYADVLGYGQVLYNPVTDRTHRIGSITLEAGSERLEVEPGWLEMLDDGMMCISISAVYLADRPALTEWMGIGAVREEDNDIYCIGKLR